MNTFGTKYPALASLILLVANLSKDFAQPNETDLQKIEGSFGLIPQILSFIPQSASLGTEIGAIKSSPEDMIAGVEMLVTDLSFTSEKATLIINAAFPLGEQIIALIPSFKNLSTAIKA